jgi:hypothetical protein
LVRPTKPLARFFKFQNGSTRAEEILMRRFLNEVAGGKGMALTRLFLLSVATVAVGLALEATTEASQKTGSFSHGSSRSYHEDHGYRFSGGYYYRGYEHNHWTYRYWWGHYGCYTYYCPSTYCWYYYYPQHQCYYPVSYISYATPVFQQAPVGVETSVKQIVNVTNNSPGSATAGVGGGGAPLPPSVGTPLPPGAGTPLPPAGATPPAVVPPQK